MHIKPNDAVVSGHVSKLRRWLPQIISVGVKNVLLLVYGLTLGIPTMLIPNLKGGIHGESIVLDEDGISWVVNGPGLLIEAMVVGAVVSAKFAHKYPGLVIKDKIFQRSLSFLSVPLGCLTSGVLTKPFGRIRSMQGICVAFFGAFLLFHFASQGWHIFLGLFLTGFTGGLLEAPTLIYTVEITEPDLRGALSSTSTLAIVIGLMTSFILGTIFPWRTMALINSSIPIAGLILLIFIPESPYWLTKNKKLEDAKKNLAWLRGWIRVEDVEYEFQNIYQEVEREEKEYNNSEHKVIDLESLKLYSKSNFIKPFLLICLTFVLAHFGTTQINTFAVQIFQVLKVPINSYYATILIGTVEFIGCILLLLLVRRLGKRILMFITQVGISLGFLFTGIYAYYIGAVNFDYMDSTKATPYSWVPLLGIVSVGFFSYLMTYTLPWIIMGELYPNEIRDTASGLSAGAGYIIGFLANKTFLNLVNIATLAGVFWFYGAVALLGLVLIYFLLPETEGKHLSEITEHYAGKARLNNKVGKKIIRANVPEGIVNKAFDINGGIEATKL